ncbi:amylo-alpha-1,6-glucosidase [Candidatus Altiarchaeota archaeon]
MKGQSIELKGFKDPDRAEFLMTNQIGGYSSSTLSARNTRKYHALLAASFTGLDRRVMLAKLDEKVFIDGIGHSLACNDYMDGTRVSDGLEYLESVFICPSLTEFTYHVGDIELVKSLEPYSGKNALKVSYSVSNASETEVEVRVDPLVGYRSFHDLMRQSQGVSSRVFSGNSLGVTMPGSYLFMTSDHMSARAGLDWHRSIKYFMEAERGEDHVEDLILPGSFHLKMFGVGAIKAKLIVACALDEAGCVGIVKGLKGRRLTSGRDHVEPGIGNLLDVSDSFVIDHAGVKSVIAGYHWFNDWGRDTMISLPGLCLVSGKLDACEQVFDRFLSHVRDGRIPSLFDNGLPDYHDFDGSLWLIDRIHQYIRYAGKIRGKRLVKKHYEKICEIMDQYREWTSSGILYHESGTWMDTLARSQAVEVQGLWYNALCIMDQLSGLAGKAADYGDLKAEVESYFMDAYWTGSHLKDCLEDGRLRPNQVILLSLDHCLVPKDKALRILDLVDEKLLTPYGLRTLSPDDPDYHGRYVGDFGERERAYHNGTVWPWLIGPYVKASIKYRGDAARKDCGKLLEGLVREHYLRAGVGTVSEVMDAEPPYTPRGCISQAWSVAEVIRAWYEDVRGEK